MSAEWVTAIASAGTFLVIAASATAALIQLRHMSGSNQIVALTECRETLESDEFRKAQRFVMSELQKRLADPEERLRIARPESEFEDEYQCIDKVANVFESLGLLVKNRIIDRTIACDQWAYVAVRNWKAIAPVISDRRALLCMPALWENFEYFAALCEQWNEKYPNGFYPAGMRRMNLPKPSPGLHL